MLSRILALFAITLLCICLTEPAVNKARQFLPSFPGYIPVYIRAGDTPLEDINQDLAAAFNSYAKKHNRLIFARSNTGKIKVDLAKELRVTEPTIQTFIQKITRS